MAAPKRTGSKTSPFLSAADPLVLPSPAEAGWHTVEEVAERYRRKPATIREWLRDGYLPGSIIGNRWLISDLQLAAFEASK